MPNYLTQDDVNNFGSDLIDFSQRAAVHALAPTLDEIRQQNANLQARLAQEAKHRLDQALDQAIPDWKTVNATPEFHRWLLQPDQFSGVIRQQLLDRATREGDAARIIAFFERFKREHQHSERVNDSVGRLPPDQRRTAASSALGQRTYTPSDIQRFYSAHQKGAFKGREMEWAKQEADFYRAQREGRVLTTPYLTK